MKRLEKIFALLVMYIFAYFLVGEILLESDVPDMGYVCEEYTEDWMLVKEDGTKIPFTLPGKHEAEKNEIVIIETVLPENIEKNMYLCFRSAKQDINIYIDGELKQHYSTEDTRLFGRTSPVAYILQEISPKDAGKVLTLETRTDSAYTGIFYKIYCGNGIGIWKLFFEQYSTELVVAFLTMVLGVVSILGSVALRLCYHRKIELEYLGWAIVITAIWLIANSMFRQLLFPNISVVNDIAFLALMILPLPFLIYMNLIQKERYQKGYYVVSITVVVNFVLWSALHVTNLIDYTDSISYMMFACFAAIFMLGATIIIDIKKGYVKEYRFVAMGILGACVAAMVQCIIYFRRTSLFSGITMALGLIFLLVFSVINTIMEILVMERDRRNALSASEAKGRFLANMSHEIRTPINAVLGMDAMILRESTEASVREYALDIQNAGRSLLSLINDILDFSKIESGKMEIVAGEYDFSSMIHDIVNMISMKAEVKNLKLNLSVDSRLPSRLYGDDVRIRQVLVNLLNNAVKYTEQGGVKLSVSGEVKDNIAVLRFAVEDTGIGIKQEDLKKLFVEFERIEEERNRHIEGTGLGMNIATNLLVLMGSRMEVESVYGKGSKFSFALEQRIIDAEPIGNLEERIRKQATEYSYDVNFTAPDAEVLVVDDNGINRKVFVNLVKEIQVRIDEAVDGFECLELIKQKKYDVIFLDHMMPGLDGIATLHRMKQECSEMCQDVPVIALTANAITGAREMYLSEGFDDFLPKPINPEKLEKMLLEHLPDGKIVYEKADKQKIPAEVTIKPEVVFEDVEGIDWEYALLHIKDGKLLKNMVLDFYNAIEVTADKLEQLYHKMLATEGEEASEYLNLYRIEVHSMKSTAAIIGAVSLSSIARMLEYAARDGRIDEAEKITPLFLKEWRSLKDRLKPFVEAERGNSDAAKTEADLSVIPEKLQLLEAAMEDMDVDTADEIMEQLNSFRYSESVQRLVERLGVAVTNLDGEQVAEWSEKIKEEIQKEEGNK